MASIASIIFLTICTFLIGYEISSVYGKAKLESNSKKESQGVAETQTIEAGEKLSSENQPEMLKDSEKSTEQRPNNINEAPEDIVPRTSLCTEDPVINFNEDDIKDLIHDILSELVIHEEGNQTVILCGNISAESTSNDLLVKNITEELNSCNKERSAYKDLLLENKIQV